MNDPELDTLLWKARRVLKSPSTEQFEPVLMLELCVRLFERIEKLERQLSER